MKLQHQLRQLRAAGERALRQPVVAWIVDRVRWVSTTGWAVVLTGASCAVIAWRVGWVEAHVLAVLCALVFTVAALWVFIPSPHAVRIHLPKNRIVAGQSAVGEIEVTNIQHRRSAAGIVELPVGAAAVGFTVPSLAGREHWSEVFSVATRKRGVIVIGPPRTVRSDALGLLRRVRTWTEPHTLLVHPKTIRVPFDATGALMDIEGVTTARLSSSDVSFHALRDYVPGDDRRNVHWPTTARVGRLIVRVFEETRRSHHMIVLDNCHDKWATDDFEIAVSAAASLGLAGVAASRKVSISTLDSWISTTTPVKMLDDFAQMGMSTANDLLHRIREVQAARSDISVMTVVVGPERTDEELAHLTAAVNVDTVCGVLRIKPGGSVRKRRLGSIRVIDCPSLDHLGRIVGSGGLA